MDKVKDFESLCAAADYFGKLAVKRDGDSVKTYCVKTRGDWAVVYDALVEEEDHVLLDREFGKTCNEFYVLSEDEMSLFHLINLEPIELMLTNSPHITVLSPLNECRGLDVSLQFRVECNPEPGYVKQSSYYIEVEFSSPIFDVLPVSYHGVMIFPSTVELDKIMLGDIIETNTPQPLEYDIKKLVKYSITETIIS